MMSHTNHRVNYNIDLSEHIELLKKYYAAKLEYRKLQIERAKKVMELRDHGFTDQEISDVYKVDKSVITRIRHWYKNYKSK